MGTEGKYDGISLERRGRLLEREDRSQPLVRVDAVVAPKTALIGFHRGVTRLEPILSADPATNLDARIGSGNVEEPGAVDATNLHVFDRFGLNGKIGSLCPSHRNETRRGTEEKAFHHLHRDLQVCCREGSVCWAPKRPGRSPKSPRN